MLNSEIVFRDAYRMFCIFMSDKAIFDMTPEDQQVWGGSQRSEEPLFRLRHQYIEDEVNHTLINLAICNRTHMERRKGLHGVDYPSAVCGKLTKDVGAEGEEDMSLREACNKIIHAEKLVATFLKDGTVSRFFSGEMEPMHHEMWLFGEFFGKNWKAELDVLAFLRATADNFELS
ncbi:hypothetical protein [Octadecabacter arcticus]|uniref:hypothetical protein n=1 Tax=Octadecabacter arcticus TaxID=53946 RepID=UPI0011818848|nr:hypothetical protein [Octadecabacter arcticus]